MSSGKWRPFVLASTDLPTLPHWAEAFRISRPASDLPHFHKIFRFQLKSDQHVFPAWTAMQLTWLSTSYHDHSSLSCPLISLGSVKTETLPALCNKNNKPIDLIHLRCSSHSSGKGRAYMVSQENVPHQTLCLTENVSFPNMHTLQTQTGTEIVTKMFEKKANEIVCLIHVIKIYLQRMALFLTMINTWWFDTWTWPWMHVYGSTNHVYCYEFIITIVGINALQYIQSIVTQTWVK